MVTVYLERISSSSSSCGSSEAQNQMLVKAKQLPQPLLRTALWGALWTQVVVEAGPLGSGAALGAGSLPVLHPPLGRSRETKDMLKGGPAPHSQIALVWGRAKQEMQDAFRIQKKSRNWGHNSLSSQSWELERGMHWRPFQGPPL